MAKTLGVLVLPEIQLRLLRNLVRGQSGGATSFDVLDVGDDEPAYWQMLDAIDECISKELKKIDIMSNLPTPTNEDEIPF